MHQWEHRWLKLAMHANCTPALPAATAAGACCQRWRPWRQLCRSTATQRARLLARCAAWRHGPWPCKDACSQGDASNETNQPHCLRTTGNLIAPPLHLQAIFTQFITSEEKGTGKGTWARYYADAPGDALGAC